MRGLLATLGCLVLASACATMSADECAMADWRSIGVQDGAAGAGMAKFTDREKACAKSGVRADLDQYQIGRQDGLRSFCVAPSGFRAGLAGYAYQGVCPADLEGDFLSGYQDGSFVHQLKEKVSSAEGAVSSARGEVDRLDDKISVFDGQARDPALSEQAREDSRKRANELRDQRRRAFDDLREAERKARWANDDLDRARYEIGGRWGPW